MMRVVFPFTTESNMVLIVKDANDEGLVGPKSFPIIFNREDFIICKFFVLMCAQAN